MDVILYAEVYLVCIVVIGVVAVYVFRDRSDSSSDRWFKALLIMFMINFVSNFFFKLVNGGIIPDMDGHQLSYLLKTLYHATLCIGVFAWCGYADSEQGSGIFQRRRSLRYLALLLLVPLVFVLLNLYNHLLFSISDSGSYVRHVLFQVEMGYLLAGSVVMAVRLLMRTSSESDPNQKSHMYLTASFPLCIAAAWIMSFVGESFPVICVCITVEILCLYIGGTRNEVSMDKLTQVNNRQNLISFMDFKAKNNNGNLYLLMIDIDDFKGINDSFGHLEGDNVLVTVAGVLKRACGPFQKRPYIARYGGDEFIVIAEMGEGGIQTLVDAINAELDKVNAGRMGYQIALSIGAVRWKPGMDHKEVIGKADVEMYGIKRRRKEARQNTARTRERPIPYEAE